MSPRRKPLQDIRTMNQLFTAAEKEALQVGESEPGDEHLILAAFELPDGSAERAFKRVGVYPKAFRDAVSKQHDDALRAMGIRPDRVDPASRIPTAPEQNKPMRFKGSSRNVFKRVVKMVKKEKTPLYGAHIVFMAAQAEHGTTARALAALGVTRDALAQAAREELDALIVE